MKSINRSCAVVHCVFDHIQNLQNCFTTPNIPNTDPDSGQPNQCDPCGSGFQNTDERVRKLIYWKGSAIREEKGIGEEFKKMVGQRRKGKERMRRILGLTNKGERIGKVEEVKRRKETNKDDINDKRMARA